MGELTETHQPTSKNSFRGELFSGHFGSKIGIIPIFCDNPRQYAQNNSVK